MDRKTQEKFIKPNYYRIYSDIIDKKYPHKRESCEKILNKQELSVLDVIKLNTLIFDIKEINNISFNQKCRAYDSQAIFEILHYQKINNLNNRQLASHFQLSRNTVTRWKKIFYSRKTN